VAVWGNRFEAVKACVDWRPDVLFLDIPMLQLNGFEARELI
jgi:DNA-binding LytR/AlgR family response regulator